MNKSCVENVPLIHILEDDQDIRDIMGYILDDAGYQIQSSSSFKEFARKIRKCNPNLILLDVMLPDGDGREICRKLKLSNNFSAVPVILISAHADKRTILIDSNADAFLSKPFDIDDLVELVKTKLIPRV